MVSIRDYLDAMVVSVTSPDGNIHARITNALDVEVSFRPGVFDRYREEALAHQLARLGVMAWVGYHRGRTEAYRRSQSLTAEEVAAVETSPGDSRWAKYSEQLNAIEGYGESTTGAVRVRTRGMMQWHVDVAAGSIRRLEERRFLDEIHAAVRALLRDREMKIILLKSDYYDLGLPGRWLELAKTLRSRDPRRM